MLFIGSLPTQNQTESDWFVPCPNESSTDQSGILPARVIDDTMFTRIGGKKTELCSKVSKDKAQVKKWLCRFCCYREETELRFTCFFSRSPNSERNHRTNCFEPVYLGVSEHKSNSCNPETRMEQCKCNY